MKHILVFCLQFYRWVLSPAKACLFGAPACCRFTPSCSEYAMDAVRQHGALGGLFLTLRRLARCHPWGGCGHDPVPHRKSGIRSPKAEANPEPARSPATRITQALQPPFRSSAFVIPSEFGLRPSDF